MFRPFMPGSYDSLSVPLSFMAQIFSISGLILVPVGLLWLIIKKLSGNKEVTERRFTGVTLVVAVLIAVFVSIGAFSKNNTSLGILFLAISFFYLAKTFLKLRKEGLKPGSLPIYLIIIPIITALVRYEYIGTAVEWSRNTAIKNSEPLIQSIENFQKRTGYYPTSLQALHYDISPKVVGIPQYFYEPNGKSFNVYFKQFSDELDVEEIVMYNKFNEHYFTAHSQDILEYSGEILVLRRGDGRRFNLSTPHWIYIKFD